jgi:hypothetical protein
MAARKAECLLAEKSGCMRTRGTKNKKERAQQPEWQEEEEANTGEYVRMHADTSQSYFK